MPAGSKKGRPVSKTGFVIKWTPEEIDKLAHACLHDKSGKAPHLILGKLQEKLLPKERWRNLNSGFFAAKKVLLRLQELKGGAEPIVVPHRLKVDKPPKPAAKVEAKDIEERVKLDLPKYEPPPAPSIASAIEPILTKWLEGIIRKVIREEWPGIPQPPTPEGITAKFVAHAPKHNPEPVQEEKKPDKPKILICGFRPDQQATFQSTFPDLQLRFYHDERGSIKFDSLASKAEWADVVYFSMGQTGHMAVAKVQAMGKRVVKVMGAKSEMMNALAEIKT